jgi:hypothetical protein
LAGQGVVAGDLAFAASLQHHRGDHELHFDMADFPGSTRCQVWRETAANHVVNQIPSARLRKCSLNTCGVITRLPIAWPKHAPVAAVGSPTRATATMAISAVVLIRTVTPGRQHGR